MAQPDRTKALESLQHVFADINTAIDLCCERNLRTPAMILLYSAIDIAGWMADQRKKVQERFTAWVDTYMRSQQRLACSSLELYGARCGVLHTFTAGSTLFDKGQVRKVVYAWLPGRVDDLREMLAVIGRSDEAAPVQGDDLVRAYKNGVEEFFSADLNQRPTNELDAIARQVFGHMPTDRVETLLANIRRVQEGNP